MHSGVNLTSLYQFSAVTKAKIWGPSRWRFKSKLIPFAATSLTAETICLFPRWLQTRTRPVSRAFHGRYGQYLPKMKTAPYWGTSSRGNSKSGRLFPIERRTHSSPVRSSSHRHGAYGAKAFGTYQPSSGIIDNNGFAIQLPL